MAQTVVFGVEEQIAWIRLMRPDALNAISSEMRGLLEDSLCRVEEDPGIRALVVTGSGKAFCAGSDVKELKGIDPAGSLALSERIGAFHDRLQRLPIPVIAAVNGLCLGGGFELALACDIRIASDAARFGFPEPRLGVMTGGGGMPRLARVAGSGVARWLGLTAQIIDAETARGYGIVSEVVPAERLERRLREIVEGVKALSPFALAQVKRVLGAGDELSLEAAIDVETEACAACFSSPDLAEGMAAFLEKRPARFR